ncbi:MAG: winged helix-turn-helix transcriptional regulator [Flexilinea sp.]|nr:winged helix-turn-helix transcriptional regulator [Flexilinea sp.]
MAEKINIDINRDLDILDNIENNPNATQASMASQMNVAIGTVNWHLKRLIDKGFVKIQRSEKRKLKYIITPEGILLRAKLTKDYIHSSFELYRLIRGRMNKVLEQCSENGYEAIYIDGIGDIEEICKLSCMEKGVKALESQEKNFPVVRVVGLKLFYEKPDTESDGNKNS